MKRHLQDWARFSLNESDPSQQKIPFSPRLRNKEYRNPELSSNLPAETNLNLYVVPGGTLVYNANKPLPLTDYYHPERDPDFCEIVSIFFTLAEDYNLKVVIEPVKENKGYLIGYMGKKSDLDKMMDHMYRLEVIDDY